MANFDSNSTTDAAVNGTNTSTPVAGVGGNSIGVEGSSDHGWGVFGHSVSGRGVVAHSDSDYGVRASSGTLSGVRASSDSGIGIEGEGLKAGLLGSSDSGTGVIGVTKTGLAGHFEGTVEIIGQDALHLAGFQPFLTLLDTENNASVPAGIQNVNGTIRLFSGSSTAMTIQTSGDVTVHTTLSVAKDVILTGADCAEHFDAMPDVFFEPGTVMAIGDGGALDASSKAYDKKVAGVVSGAGGLRPAILLDYQASDTGRPAVALNGKVYVKVDAEYGAIEVGDLLTTSDTLGHAMRASDPTRAFGAVIGKALRPLKEGRALIPILIALQ